MSQEYSLAIMLCVPENIAQYFPYKPEDPSIPHITLGFTDVNPALVDDISKNICQAISNIPKLQITLTELDYLELSTGRVAFVGVTLTPELQMLYSKISEVYTEHGLDIKHYLGYFMPHITLAYLQFGEVYTGPMPLQYSWYADGVEIWYNSLKLKLPFGQTPQTSIIISTEE